MLLVELSQRTGNLSSAIATIMVDRRTVAVSNVYIDITQSAEASSPRRRRTAWGSRSSAKARAWRVSPL
jgi:hypothetical protein